MPSNLLVLKNLRWQYSWISGRKGEGRKGINQTVSVPLGHLCFKWCDELMCIENYFAENMQS